MTDAVMENVIENVNEKIENAENSGLSGEQKESVISENTEKSDKKNATDSNQTDDTIYGSPDSFDYSEIKLPEGMTLDEDLVKEFNPLAKKFNLSNSSANELMNLAVKLSNKNAESLKDAVEQMKVSEKNSYLKLLSDDKELNTHNQEVYDQYLDVATQGLKAVSTPEFNEFLREKGLTHHPEFIKVFHKIGELCKEASVPNATLPVGAKQSPADILYGKSSNK